MSLQRLVVRAAAAGWIAIAAPIAGASGAATVSVDGVDVEQVRELAPGVPLHFSVYGTPGAAAALRIEGGWRVLALRETEPGIYEGSYLIDRRDSIAPASGVTATLQRGGSVAAASLEGPLVLAKGPLPWADAEAAIAAPKRIAVQPPRAVPMPSAVPSPRESPPAMIIAPPRSLPLGTDTAPKLARAGAPTRCEDCATVESVRRVDEAPPVAAIGALAGAIAGAVLGNELGEAHTRRLLGVLGAIGGALTGREIQRQASYGTHYDVVFRRADGSLQMRRYDRSPPFAPGDTVRLDGAAVHAAPSAAPF